MMLTRKEEELCRIVANESATAAPTIRRLFACGLIDRRRAEAIAIRRTIEGHRRQGARTTDAVTWAAEEYCCSYEKARNIYYSKP